MSEVTKHYEALWYEVGKDDPVTREFRTKKQALDFYNKHKDDQDKTDWWVTKRDDNWSVVEDIIF